MLKIKKILLLILVFFVFSCNLYASEKDNDTDYILVLNSINFNEIKTRLFFEAIRDEFSSGHVKVIRENLGLKLSVKEESLSVPALQTLDAVVGKQRELRQKYTGQRKPLALLFIGDPGWLLSKPLFDDVWKDVPAVVCMARDRMAPELELMLNKDEEELKTILKPTEEVLKPYNVVAIKQPVYIKKTVELMKNLLPGMNKIVFISDQRYISLFTRIELRDTMKKYFPEIELKELISPQLNTQNLLDSLSVFDRNTGVIYFSWFVPVRKSIDTYLEDNIQTIVSAFSKSPVFILTDLNPESGRFAGGCYIEVQAMSKICTDVLYRILKGEQPRDMPAILGGTPVTVLNYTHLVHFNIPVSNFPSDVVYVQVPLTFWEEYKWSFLKIGIILILLLIIVVMRIRGYVVRQRIYEWKIQLLRRNRRFFENLCCNLPVAVTVRDVQNHMKFLFWNKSAERMFGINEKQMIENQDVAIASNEIFLNMDRDDKKYIDKTGQSSGLYKFKSRKGNVMFLYVNRRIISSTDGKKWLFVTAWDMTKQQRNQEILKKLNERLQMVMKVAQMGIWTYDIRKSTFYYDNEYSYSLKRDKDIRNQRADTEYTSSISLEEMRNIVYPADRKSVRDSFLKLIGQETHAFSEEYRVYNSLKGTDTINWVHGYATILKRDSEGNPTILVGANMNIDKQKEMEYRLREAKKVAEEANKLKDVFLANMSHEIRTPLNAIVGFSSILASAENPAEKYEYIDIIESNTDLLLQLVNDILDLSKLETNTLEFIYRDVDINAMFEKLEKSSRSRLDHSGVEILFVGRLPELTLSIDPNRLMQVMSNFMNNAIKYTHQGSICFGYRPMENGQWYFYLRDTGEGIPADRVDSVFERFVKLDSFKQGTGLGLAICKSIIERFGGKIGVDSQIGIGSTFWFVLPDMRPKVNKNQTLCTSLHSSDTL